MNSEIIEKIARIIIICIGVFGLIILGMYAFGFMSGWLEVLNENPVSTAHAHIIHYKLDEMKNPIFRAGYEKGLRMNSSYSYVSLEAWNEELEVSRKRLEVLMKESL